MIEAKRGGAIVEAAASNFVSATADRPFAASRMVEAGPLTIAIHFADHDLEALFADAFYPAPASQSASWSLFVLAAAEGEPLPLPGFSADEPEMRLVESAEIAAMAIHPERFAGRFGLGPGVLLEWEASPVSGGR